MHTHINKNTEHKSSAANSLPVLPGSNSRPIVQLVDNRPQSIAQRRLKGTAGNVPAINRSTPAHAGPIQKKEAVFQFNGDGLRRRFPAPPEPARAAETEYNGPGIRAKIEAYKADIAARPAFYAKKGLLGMISFIIGQLGFNIPKAIFNTIVQTPAIIAEFTRLSIAITSGNEQNAAAEGVAIMSRIGVIIETAIGTEGAITTATTAIGYASGGAKQKEKKE